MDMLYDGPHLQVLRRSGSSPYLLVTFNERGMRANGRVIWAQSLADKLDLNAIGFVSKKPNWFPHDDLAAACAAVLPALAPFQERIGYGFSQGAYAAIKASRLLGLSHTIAVSPQFSIDPADVDDRRFVRFFDPGLNAGMRIVAADAPRALHIFYDRRQAEDAEHVARILLEIPGARAHHMPSTYHETIRVFADSSAFPDLIAAVVADAPEAIASRLRRASLVRKAIMVQRAIRSRRLERAFALFEATPHAGARRSVLLAEFALAGGAVRALSLAEADLRQRPDDPLNNAVMALALAVNGRPDESRLHLETARSGLPHGRIRRIVERTELVLASTERPVTATAPAPPPSSDAARPSRRTGFWSALLSRTRRRPG